MGLARRLADLAAALRFFSRLPVPRLGPADDPAAMPDFGRAAGVIPLAGALLALPAAVLAALLAASDLPAMAVAALAVGLQIAVTGALHEDGLADVADGFFGASRRERRLEIMKDSRIGAFGALALGLALILRVVLVAALAEAGPAAVLLALPAAGAAGRAVMVLVWHHLPPARTDGLSVAAGRPGTRAASEAAAVGLAIALPALAAGGISGGGVAGVVTGLALAFLAAAAMARLARAKIGGQTGDVLGATEQLGGLGFLIGLLI